MKDTHAPGGVIVVGVDSSESSARALRWALRQAAATGGIVEAVTAWEYPQYSAWSGLAAGAWDEATFREGARQMLAGMLEKAGPEPGVEVRARVEHGHAAAVLLEVSRDAQLLVLGSRGHGGFTGALLGSVGQHCIHHAQCPVVIVRDAPSD